MVYDLVEENIENDNWTFNLEWLMLPSPSSDDGIESDSVETDSVIVKLIYAFSCVLIVGGVKPNYRSDGYEQVEVQFDEIRRLVSNALNGSSNLDDFEVYMTNIRNRRTIHSLTFFNEN